MLTAFLCLTANYLALLIVNFRSPFFYFSYLIGEMGFYGLFLFCYLYLVEIIEFNKKVFSQVSWFTYNSLIGLTFRIPLILGDFVISTWISYYQPSGKTVYLSLVVISFMPIYLLLAWLPESPQWLLSKFKVREAEEVLNEMARLNGKKVTVKVDIVVCDIGRTDWDGAKIDGELALVKLGDRKEVLVEKRSYSMFSLFNVNLLQYTFIFYCIWMLIPLSLVVKSGIDKWQEFIVGVGGILFTMGIEGFLGRRNCLMIFMLLLAVIALVTDIMQKANSAVLNDKQKNTNVFFIKLVQTFIFEPINSLIYLMTLSIYPSALRYDFSHTAWVGS